MRTDIPIRCAFLCALTTLLLFAPALYATNGMKVIGVGPVQRSMGGANVALPLDAAVAITNPAGLSQLHKRIDIAATYFAPDVSYKAHSDAGMITNDNSYVSSDTGPCIMPGLGGVVPINDRYTFGLGAYGVCGMSVDYEQNLYNNITYTDYAFMKLAPALAFRIDDNLSIGAALNLDYATMEFEAGTTSEVSHNDGHEFGLGFTAGAIYKLTNAIAVGIAYESRQDFSDFEFNTNAGTDKLALEQPQNITLGLGIRPNDRLRIAFDVAWIDWPQTVGENKPEYTENSSGAAAWNMNWDDQYVYKVGVEYDLNEKVKVRAGYNYGKCPLDSSRAFENISFPAIAEHHITAGAGIALSRKLALNIGFVFSPQATFNTHNSAQYIDSATTKMSQYAIDIGFAYTF